MRRALIGFLAVLATGIAHADEQTRVITTSGDWVALTHSPSEMAAPDACLAFQLTSKFLLRLDQETFEARISDKSWSLPAGAEGKMRIQVGSFDQTLDSQTFNATGITAIVPVALIQPMLDALSAGSTAFVTVGKEAPRTVDLSGSGTVLNAFRTCGGISGSAKGAGSNPFE